MWRPVRPSASAQPPRPDVKADIQDRPLRARSGHSGSSAIDATMAVISTFRQTRLAEPVSTMFDILGVLREEKNRFPAFNCETGVDPQHLRGFRPRLLKLPGLRIGGRQHEMGQ